MPGRFLAVLLATALAAVAALRLVCDGPSEDGAAGRADGPAEPSAAVQDDLERPADGVRVGIGLGPVRAGFVLEAFEARGAEFELRAVELDGKPVPRAVVHVWAPERTDWTPEYAAEELGVDPVAATEERGRRYVADDAGRLRIPRPERAFLVLARGAAGNGQGALGFLECIPPDTTSPTWLWLEPMASLRVRALDERGRPVAGLELALGDRWCNDTLWRGSTDEHGAAEISQLAVGSRGAPVHLVAAVPGLEPIGRWCPGDFEGAETVELRVPAAAAIEIVFVDGSGARMPVWDRLELAIPREILRRLRVWDEPDRVTVPVRDGIARIVAPPGDRNWLDVHLEAGNGAWTIERPKGGAWPAHVKLPLDFDGECLRATVVDATGRPIGDRGFAWGHTSVVGDKAPCAWHEFESGRVRSDAEGHVLLPNPGELDPPRRQRLFLFDDDASVPLVGELELAHVAGPERWPRVTLLPAEVAFAGRALDTLGRPVAYARVLPEQAVLEGERIPPPLFRSVRTDARGTFTAYGPRTDARVVLGLELGDESLAVLEGSAGSRWGEREIALTVVASGSVEGQVLLDVPPGQVDVAVLDGRDESVDTLEYWETADGLRFRALALEPGTYSVRFAGETAGGSIVVADVRVAAGEPTLDPRLMPLDLRGRFARRELQETPEWPRLRFTDATGVRIAQGFVSFEADADWSWPMPWVGGSVAVPPHIERVAAWSPRCQLVLRQAPARDATWVLGPAPVMTFELVLPPACRTPALRFSAKVDVASQSEEPFECLFDDARIVFDERGQAELELPGAGRWSVDVAASWGTEEDWGSVAFDAVVLDFESAAPDRFPLVHDAAAWEAQLRAAGAPMRAP